MQCELNDIETPDGGGDHASAVSTPGASSSPQSSAPQTHLSSSSNNSTDGLRDNVPCLKYYNSDISALACVCFTYAVASYTHKENEERLGTLLVYDPCQNVLIIDGLSVT